MPRSPTGSEDQGPSAGAVVAAAAAAKQEGVARGMDEDLATNAAARAAHTMLLASAASPKGQGAGAVQSAFAGMEESGFGNSSSGELLVWVLKGACVQTLCAGTAVCSWHVSGRVQDDSLDCKAGWSYQLHNARRVLSVS